jgi:hypothetical protein
MKIRISAKKPNNLDIAVERDAAATRRPICPNRGRHQIFKMAAPCRALDTKTYRWRGVGFVRMLNIPLAFLP